MDKQDPYCRAQGTISNLLGYTIMEKNALKNNVYMCQTESLLSWDWHNTANQLYLLIFF